MLKRSLMIGLVSLALISAVAAVPQKMNFQGRLTDPSGNPITTAVDVKFSIFDATSGGSELWTETVNLTPDQGLVNQELGLTAPIAATVFSGDTRYLAVKVGTDSEMTPRIPLATVPFAFRAAVADAVAAGQVVTSIASLGAATALKDNVIIEGGSGVTISQNILLNKLTITAVSTAGGTVSQVNTGTGLTGGPITTTGTISIANGGVAAGQLATSAVTAGAIADDTITEQKINMMNGPTNNYTLTYTATGLAWGSPGGTGTVTQVNTGTGLTGGPITTTGTISLAASGVTAGYYPVASVTVDAYGRITAASASNAVTGSGAATRVAYWNGTSNLTSSSNLFWDNTNTRLGLGTAVPQKTLHVNLPAMGGDASTGMVIQRNAENDANKIWLRNTSGTDLWSIGMDGASPTNAFRIDSDSTLMLLITSNGNTRLGHLASTDWVYDTKLEIASYDVAGNNVMDLLKLSRDSFAGPSNGIGCAIAFRLEDSTGILNDYSGRISSVFDDVTNGSEDSSFRFSVMNGGSLTESLLVDNLGLDIRGVNYTWPNANPGSSAVLTNDGAGVLTWSPSGSVDLSGYVKLGPTTGQTTTAAYAIQVKTTNAGGVGISGETTASSGYGVYGANSATTGGTGGYFKGGTKAAIGRFSIGVEGMAGSGNYYGELGREAPTAMDTTSDSGVYGYASTLAGKGVYGLADATTGAGNTGGYFEADGDTGTGVYGYGKSSAGGKNYGVYGRTDSAGGYGVYGSATSDGFGVYGYVNAMAMNSIALCGETAGPDGYALVTRNGPVSFETSSLDINTVHYTWPSANPGSAAVLTNDGAGALSWAPGGGPMSGYVELGPVTAQTTTAAYAVRLKTTHASGIGISVETDSRDGAAIMARNNSTTGTSAFGLAVVGKTSLADTYGVLGYEDSGLPEYAGVYGKAVDSDSAAIYGKASGSASYAGRFESLGGSAAIWAINDNVAAGTQYGIYVQTPRSDDYAVYANAESTSGVGVYANAGTRTGILANSQYGAYGSNGTLSYGYLGGSGYGAGGINFSSTGRGVTGSATHETGTNYGGYFSSASSNGTGVYGINSSTTGITKGGAFQVTSSNGYAVYGSNSTIGTSWGYIGGSGTAVYGITNVATGSAVYGYSSSSAGVNYAGYFNNTGSTGYGIFAQGATYAAFMQGRVKMFSLAPAGGGTILVLTPGSQEVVPQSSSRRYKKEIVDYQVDSAKLNSLRPVRFKWNDVSATPNYPDFGLIAEEVENVYPELVTLNQNGSPESVAYDKIGVILIKVLQEKNKEIEALKVRLKALEDKIK